MKVRIGMGVDSVFNTWIVRISYAEGKTLCARHGSESCKASSH